MDYFYNRKKNTHDKIQIIIAHGYILLRVKRG